MYYCSEAAKYLPELDSTGIVSFAACAGSEPFLPPTSSSFWTQNAGGATTAGGVATVATPSSGKDTGYSFHDGTTTTTTSKGGGETSGGGGSLSETDKGNLIPGASLGPATVRAGENLDEVIATLLKNFGAGSDYFKVLVKVFQSVLLDTEHDGSKHKDKGLDQDKDKDKNKGKGKDKSDAAHEHLKNFYMIVPALCISWTDAALQAKDNMFKATRSSMHGSRYMVCFLLYGDIYFYEYGGLGCLGLFVSDTWRM